MHLKSNILFALSYIHAIRHIIWTLRSEKGHDNENVKKGKDVWNNNSARAAHFFVHFLAVTARLRRENAWFHVLWWTQTGRRRNFPSLSELENGYWEFNSGEFAYIWQRKWVELIPMKIERTPIVQFRVRYDGWIKEVKTHFLQA